MRTSRHHFFEDRGDFEFIVLGKVADRLFLPGKAITLTLAFRRNSQICKGLGHTSIIAIPVEVVNGYL